MNKDTVVVHNPTDHSIIDYPIEDPTSKEVFVWSIKPNETLTFPYSVGMYLLEIYGFLQRVVTEEELKAETAEKKKMQEGKHFNPIKVVRSPAPASDAPAEPVDTPQTPSGFTSESMGSTRVAEPTPQKDAQPTVHPGRPKFDNA